MNFFRNFWNRSQDGFPMNRVFNVNVDGTRVPSVYVDESAPPERVLSLLKLDTHHHAAIFITGGASKMTEHDKQMTRLIFEEAIAPFAQQHQIIVIDGATRSGVIEMMATARLKHNYTFPLIGMVPFSRITFPGKNTEGDALCVGHSHFAFVTGDNYGAESELLIGTAHAAAGGKPNQPDRVLPTIGIVVNGGQITRQEAYMATTDSLSIPLIVLEGSGRFADELATAARTGETSQSLVRSIIRRGNIQLVAAESGPAAMVETLKKAFSATK